ncbi:MAG: putative transporter [Parachlamydiales bacterium]|nr:putative transporter [Parachlamydiales bacterium]
MQPPTAPRRFMNIYLLALLNLSVMTSLRNLPIVSHYGYGLIFFYAVVAIGFLFPCALISAELATGWSRTGGIYIWVREAFGPKWGFFAVWMQWIHNVTWFPAILSFSAVTLAYIINPALAENKLYLISAILGGFWGTTLFNCLGLKISSWFSALGVIAGTILPGLIIIGLGMLYLALGHPMQIQFTARSLIPPLDDIQNIVFLAGLFLAFGGLEVTAVHAREVQNPQRNFPRAILMASGIALLLYIAGALSIALVIPTSEINLVAGLMDAFQVFFADYHMSYLLTPIAIMIIFGAVGELNAWIIGPVRALHATSKHGDLPPVFQKLNKHGVPSNLLYFQGVVVTVATFVFMFMPSASSAFWILSAMSVQIYLVMYVLMFLAAIKLRYSHNHVIRPYRIPYNMPGIWLTGGIGIISSVFAFAIGFVPPGQFETGSLLFYEGFLTFGIITMAAIPLIIFALKKESWHVHANETE